VRPVGRGRWLGGRLAVGAALAALCGLVGGLAAWAGAAVEDSGVSMGRMVSAGANVVPPALLVLGIGALAQAVRPRLAAAVAYGVIAWSFLVELVGALVDADHVLLDTSIFHHMRPVPAADADLTAAVVMVGLGLAAAVVGGLVFERRDLAGA
jgi:ABC-2 type transport system permease protein